MGTMKRLGTVITGVVVLAGMAACGGSGSDSGAQGGEAPPVVDDLRVHGNSVIELTPVHYAIKHLDAAQTGVARGGIPTLFEGSDGAEADLAGHAEIQGLQNSLDHPDLRIILTVTEGHYRIVAKRSAGIRSMADLKGKRILTHEEGSPHFYLLRALETVGMTDSDVEVVKVDMPPKGIAQMLVDGDADAVALWDPEPQIAIDELGDDAVILSPDTGYQELYNLNTTAAKLADPTTRDKIVRFVAKLIQAAEKMEQDAPGAIALAAETTGYSPDLIKATWQNHTFSTRLSPDLLETLVAEEVWLAGRAGRTARPREELAKLIDPTIEAEARALLRKAG